MSNRIEELYQKIKELNYPAINEILREIDSEYFNEGSDVTANKIFDDLIQLDKEGRIDITNITSSIMLIRRNPIYFVKKSTSFLTFCNKLDSDTTLEILNYLSSIKYLFTNNDDIFIDNCVINNIDTLSLFIAKCEYNQAIFTKINSQLEQLSKETVYELYNRVNSSNKKHFLTKLLHLLNYNNYKYNTIIKDKDLCLDYDISNKNQIVNLLKEIHEKGFNANIVLLMEHINLDFINELYAIVGDKLKILPGANQTHNKPKDYESFTNRKYYDVDYIRKSESKLNLYAATVNDVKDKDGNIKSLSPLEKYIAAYILTSKFAPYKEENMDEDASKSRSVYEFINTNSNTKIVCSGYVHLLREILYRMGITETIDWSVNNHGHHARMMIHLKDDKYGIDGIYMADPTWDDHDITKKSIQHMLMSHDELLEIDKEVSLADLRADNYKEMEEKLHVSRAIEMFFKPIPKDAIIKAHLAVEHFLDKNMKMVNEYDLLEYTEMAEKLNIYDAYEKNSGKVFKELQQLSINTIKYDYPGLLDSFLYSMIELLREKLKEKGYNIPIVGTNHNNQILIGLQYEFNTDEFTNRNLDINTINQLNEYTIFNKIDKNIGLATLYVYELNDKPISEQYEDIINKIIEFNDISQNITSNIENNKLK